MVGFPRGARVTIEALDRDPHPLLAELRAHEPVSWIPALNCWLVTRHELALAVMRDAARFTVEDPRFSTARVIGPSMLSLDGDEHGRHRSPFTAAFRPDPVHRRFEQPAALEADRLIDAMRPAGRGEVRREFAGPLAASIIAHALGLTAADSADVLRWYGAIVGAVHDITSGESDMSGGAEAFAELSERLRGVLAARDGEALLVTAAGQAGLSPTQIVSNAAVLLFGGIETTEGMITNALLHLLRNADALPRVYAEPRLVAAAIEESLRLEPAAAVIDRYATTDVRLGDAEIGAGDLVRVSIAAANRDPEVFEEPDRFDLARRNSRRHLAFAQGPHVCLGVHLARLEARTALLAALEGLPSLRLDRSRPANVRGLVFRKPEALHVVWNT